jgi:hypothetical protein
MNLVTMTNMRRDVLGTIGQWPMTATQVCSAIGIEDGSKTSVDRALSWACNKGYAVRASSVRGTAKRGCHAFLYRLTDKGRALYEAMRGISLRSQQARQIVDVAQAQQRLFA